MALSADGRRAALSRDGETVAAALDAPADASFEVREAAPLPGSPRPEAEAPVEGVRKLAVHLDGVDAATVAVRIGPGVAPREEVVPLAEWSPARLG